MLAQPHAENEARGLSPVARDVLGLLRAQGASFFADIVRGTARLKAEVETGLWELVAAGLITADSFDNLRALIDPKRRAGVHAQRGHRPRHSTGRWALLPRPAAHHDGQREQSTAAAALMLLERYGVVFRDLLARETLLPKWRELLIAFRRMEAQGEVRGGRFVDGFIGEQYAMPQAVESLRAMRNAPPANELITVSAADPLNLAGIIVPGERVPAISGRYVNFRNGAVADAPAQAQIVAAIS
jgi:ATP-dependent Lhr-like helicase